MAHVQQQQFFLAVKAMLPQFFNDVKVVDFGSLDINGCNRSLFSGGQYIGVDLAAGKNVDVICKAHEYDPPWRPDVVISSEMLEHDKHWAESLRQMFRVVRSGGLMLFTCATTGRGEHGTTRTTPGDSPFTNDWYRNLTEEDVRDALPMGRFAQFEISTGEPADLRFWGIK